MMRKIDRSRLDDIKQRYKCHNSFTINFSAIESVLNNNSNTHVSYGHCNICNKKVRLRHIHDRWVLVTHYNYYHDDDKNKIGKLAPKKNTCDVAAIWIVDDKYRHRINSIYDTLSKIYANSNYYEMTFTMGATLVETDIDLELIDAHVEKWSKTVGNPKQVLILKKKQLKYDIIK